MFKIPANPIAVSVAAILFSAGVASAAFVDYNGTDGFILDQGLTLRNNSSITFEKKAGGTGDFVFDTQGAVQLRFGVVRNSLGQIINNFSSPTSAAECTALSADALWDSTASKCHAPAKNFIVKNGAATPGTVLSVNNDSKMAFGNGANGAYLQAKDDGDGIYLEAALGSTAAGLNYNNGLLIRRGSDNPAVVNSPNSGDSSADWGLFSVRNLPPGGTTGAAYLGFINKNDGLFVGQGDSRVTGDMTVTGADVTLANMVLTVEGNLILPKGVMNFSDVLLGANTIPGVRLQYDGSTIKTVNRSDASKTFSFAAKNYWITDLADDPTTFGNTSALSSSAATKGWIEQLKPNADDPTKSYPRFVTTTPPAHVDWANILEVAKMNGQATQDGTSSANATPINEVLTMNNHAPY